MFFLCTVAYKNNDHVLKTRCFLSMYSVFIDMSLCHMYCKCIALWGRDGRWKNVDAPINKNLLMSKLCCSAL